jgi:lipopolysaccharide transport system ATP-binding protein
MGQIVVSNVGKAYKRYPSHWARLLEWLGPADRPRHQAHWVLRGVSFEVAPGEAVGIVGTNGAGKSTLLKIITGTTQPTEGTVTVVGRIAALLELGMGFHPDFTGRQNVFMAGQLLGLNANEITQLMPEIEAFAEIGDYIDQPVRTYSSGMQVRLAFSVATAKRPDILIVDEALSVGDVYFQHKCLLRIRSFKEKGTTLLFVSHSPDTVRMLCQRGILLEGGMVIKNADAASVMDYYRASQVRRCELATPGKSTSDLEEGEASLAGRQSKSVLTRKSVGGVNVELFSPSIPLHSGDLLTIQISAVFNEAHADPHIGFGLRNKMGIVIYEANTYTLRHSTRSVQVGEQLKVSFTFPCRLLPGTYELMVGIADGGYDCGSFERSLFFDQSYLIFEVLAGTHIGWGGLWNIEPEIAVS